MLKFFEIKTAWRYIWSPKRDGFVSVISLFSVLGITLGVAALVVVMSVMGGFRQELLGRILGMTGDVTLSGVQGSIKNFDLLRNRLMQSDAVVSATAVIDKHALLFFRGSASGVVVRGIRPKSLNLRRTFKHATTREDRKNFAGGKGLLLGNILARMYGINAGDTVGLMVLGESVNPAFDGPRVRYFRVAGTFKVGMYDYDSSTVLMPLRKAQSLFSIDGVTQVEVVLKDPEQALRFVKDNAHSYPSFYMDAWQRVNMSFFNALKVENNTMFIILATIVLIASFNIVTGQILMVRDKVRAISIMRAIGVKRSSIVKIFFLTGSALGVFGTGIGVILGLTLLKNLDAIRNFIKTYFTIDVFDPKVYSLTKIPFVVDVKQIVFIMVLSIVITLVAALYPAIKSGRIDPSKGMIYG